MLVVLPHNCGTAPNENITNIVAITQLLYVSKEMNAFASAKIKDNFAPKLVHQEVLDSLVSARGGR
jgi:hypothetical protein